MRPLGIPSFDDKLVQEVVRMILEAIYEGYFEDTSHGFRPRRSCHTALTDIQKGFTGTKWFIEGDIKGFFDNIDHECLIEIMQERIADERFLRFIRKFLKAGSIEQWTYNRTYSGTPQGGIISPILANIYLDKFDKYIKEYVKQFNKGEVRKRRAEYSRLKSQIYSLERTLKTSTKEHLREQRIEKIKMLRKELVSIPVKDEMDASFRRMKYVRYADDFLIGVIGSKAECVKIKEDITTYMAEKLHLEMSQEKTLITHAQKAAKFLGYEISVEHTQAMKRNINGVLKREFNGKIKLMMPMEVVRKKLLSYDVLRITQKDGKEIWQPKTRTKFIGWKAEDLVTRYNAEIRGLYNYYRIARNVSALGSSFGYIMEYSFCCTLGRKWNVSISKVRAKLYHDKKLVIPYLDKKGNSRYRIFYNEGFKRQLPNMDAHCDDEPLDFYGDVYPSMVERLKGGICECCGRKSDTLIMHHVRKLRGLKPDTDWNKAMIKMHRKSLAVCETCNEKILSYDK